MRNNLAFALLLLGACTSSPSDTASVESNLESPTGGYDMTDEAPMFAEDAQFAASGLEMPTAVADSAASDPSVIAMAGAGAAVREVNLVWGHMPADRDDHSPRPWDGSFTVSRGAIIVEQTIQFEQDDQLLPRTSHDMVAFDSRTFGYHDGLALEILDPDPSSTAPLTLTYTPALPAAQPAVFDLGMLTAGPIVQGFEDGNRMIAIAEHARDGCLGGFMRGRWHRLPTTTAAGVVGRFIGIVTDRHGEHIGHIHGIYGERTSGEHVAFGKFIDREGHFQGLLRGRYTDDTAPQFQFRARWTDADHDERGRIHGEFVEGMTDGSGTFVARWAETACSEDDASAPM